MKFKNKYFFHFSLLTLFFLINSCTDVVQVKLDEGSKIIVIDAFVNDSREDQKIRLTYNAPYFSNGTPPGVTGALVILKDLTINKSFSFSYSNNGNYIYKILPGDTLGKTNHQFELNVTVDGTTYTSLGVQKRKAKIDSIQMLSVNRFGGGGPPNAAPRIDTIICLLWAKDKTDASTDYYWIKVKRNDTIFSDPNDINLCIDGTGGPVNDARFDSTEFTPPATFLAFKRYKLKDKCTAEIHSISRECYYFLGQAQAQIANGGLFATTPENVRTNIVTPKDAKTKAVGWFNIASVDSRTRVIK